MIPSPWSLLCSLFSTPSSFEELLWILSIWLAAEILNIYLSRVLFIDIIVTFFLPPIDGGDLQIVTEFATFKHFLWLLPHKATGEAARAAVAAALRELHVDDVDGRLSYKIVDRSNKDTMAQRNSWIGKLKVIGSKQHFCLCVDKLPLRTGFDNGALTPSSFHLNIDEAYDAGMGFVRVSKESVQGLLKTTQKTEEAVICEECSEEVPIGSELTRLPCSHRFHLDCVVLCLAESKLCPQCRFELP